MQYADVYYNTTRESADTSNMTGLPYAFLAGSSGKFPVLFPVDSTYTTVDRLMRYVTEAGYIDKEIGSCEVHLPVYCQL